MTRSWTKKSVSSPQETFIDLFSSRRMVLLSLFFWIYLAITISFVNSFRGSFGFHRLSNSKRGFSKQPTTSSQQKHIGSLILTAHEQTVVSKELTIKNIDRESNKVHFLVTVNGTLTDIAFRRSCNAFVKVRNFAFNIAHEMTASYKPPEYRRW